MEEKKKKRERERFKEIDPQLIKKNCICKNYHAIFFFARKTFYYLFIIISPLFHLLNNILIKLNDQTRDPVSEQSGNFRTVNEARGEREREREKTWKRVTAIFSASLSIASGNNNEIEWFFIYFIEKLNITLTRDRTKRSGRVIV